MYARPQKKDARTCCCCIPIRAGAFILTILYFLGGVATAAGAVLILINGKLELTTTTNGIVVALGILGVFLAITSAIGFSSAIRLDPSSSSLFANLFTFWFFLEVILDIAIIVMLFTKSLDSIVPICSDISSLKSGIGRSTMEKNCETMRNRMSWYWLVSMLVRSLVGYYFVRRMSSFSRHCAERAESQFPPSTQMAPTTIPGTRNGQIGTMLASNFPSQGTYESRPRQPHSASTPAPEQAGFPAQDKGQAYQESTDSLQSTAKGGDAPTYYNAGAEKAV